jgi:hypothetical protein
MVTHQLTSQIRIALDKPMAALNWAESIQKSVNKLKEFSQLGREVPKVKKAGIRELLKENYESFIAQNRIVFSFLRLNIQNNF